MVIFVCILYKTFIMFNSAILQSFCNFFPCTKKFCVARHINLRNFELLLAYLFWNQTFRLLSSSLLQWQEGCWKAVKPFGFKKDRLVKVQSYIGKFFPLKKLSDVRRFIHVGVNECQLGKKWEQAYCCCAAGALNAPPVPGFTVQNVPNFFPWENYLMWEDS